MRSYSEPESFFTPKRKKMLAGAVLATGGALVAKYFLISAPLFMIPGFNALYSGLLIAAGLLAAAIIGGLIGWGIHRATQKSIHIINYVEKQQITQSVNSHTGL